MFCFAVLFFFFFQPGAFGVQSFLNISDGLISSVNVYVTLH